MIKLKGPAHRTWTTILVLASIDHFHSKDLDLFCRKITGVIHSIYFLFLRTFMAFIGQTLKWGEREEEMQLSTQATLHVVHAVQ